MTLQFDTGMPWIFHAFASLLLFAHIAGGTVGMASGAVSILARRGGRVHRTAGNVFFVAMLCMAGVGATVAPFLVEDQGRWTNTVAGTFTLYLVVTGWMTVRRPPGEAGRMEKVGLAVGAALALLGLVLLPVGLVTGQTEALMTIYIFCAIAGVAALGDYKLVRRGGLRGGERIARHLWRMGLALAITMGSFFVGQQDELPKAVQGTFLIAIPPLGSLGLMLFWLVRTRLSRGFRPPAQAAS